MSPLTHRAGKLLVIVTCGRPALLAGCVAAFAALALSAPPANAGCNSGNVHQTNRLDDASCQAAAAGTLATAVGSEASAAAIRSTAVGAGADADFKEATALGAHTSARDPGSTSVGTFAAAWANHATALGKGALAQGDYSTAIGAGGTDDSAQPRPHTLGRYSIAIGTGAQTFGEGSVAVGYFAATTPARSPSRIQQSARVRAAR